MPLNFPNQWGVKKDWSLPEESEHKRKNEHIRYVNGHKGIKCPECGRWVRYFRFAADSTDYGRIYADMETETLDSHGGDIYSITCVECGNDVFDDRMSKMAEYAEEE